MAMKSGTKIKKRHVTAFHLTKVYGAAMLSACIGIILYSSTTCSLTDALTRQRCTKKGNQPLMLRSNTSMLRGLPKSFTFGMV